MMLSAWVKTLRNSTRRLRPGTKTQAVAIPTPRIRTTGASGGTGRLLFVNQYYWPDHASTAQHLSDLVESLVAQGHECHVLCGQGTYKPGTPRPPAFEMHNGVHIHRVRTTSLGRKSTLHRMIDYLSFYVRAVVTALLMPRFDVVTTLTTPPMIGLVGTLLRRFRGTSHVFWSMDLHPDASLALGRMSRKNLVVAALAWLSDLIYRQADKVVVLGPYMADLVAAKGVRPDRLEVVPVWSRRDEIYPLSRDGHPLRERMGLTEPFIAMYSGNLGLAHCFDEFLAAAERLKSRSDILFLFVGDGPRMKEVRAAQEQLELNNVRILDYFPRELLHASLSLADVHLTSLRREMTGIVVPSKVYGAMASGRPVLFVGPDHSESADTIREADCGITIRLGDVDGLVAALERLATSPELVQQMGRRGRAGFLASYEQATCCARWCTLIGDMIPAPRQAPAPVLRPIGASVAGGSV